MRFIARDSNCVRRCCRICSRWCSKVKRREVLFKERKRRLFMTTFSCRQTEHLEKLAAGEVLPLEANALHAHLSECAVCRNEFRWLQTEYQLVAQRRASSLAARAPAPLSWRHGIAIAAAAVLAVAFAQSRSDLSVEAIAYEPFESREMPVLESKESMPRRCSVLPEGLGFHCSLPVNIVASRDSSY